MVRPFDNSEIFVITFYTVSLTVKSDWSVRSVSPSVSSNLFVSLYD